MKLNQLTVALLGATALTAMAAMPAEAATKKKTTTTTTKTTTPTVSNAQIKALMEAQQSKIDALTAEVNALKSAQSATAADAAAADEAATKSEFLAAQVDAQQAQLDSIKKATAANAASWKGAPQLSSPEGWSFKVRGRFMYDAAYTENPNNNVPTKDLGFASGIRRFRIGVEGSFLGDWSYKGEVDFAQAGVGFGDVLMQYRKKGSPWEFTIGHYESYDGLEQISSSRFLNFMERDQFNGAFNNTRRLGAGVGYYTPDNVIRINAGVFNDTINADRGFNDDWIGAGRIVIAPQAFGGQLHFGANYQHRKFQSAPTTGATNGLNLNYAFRPFVQTTNTTFVSTGALAARGDDIFGLEFAGIFHSLHISAEGQYTKVDAITPTDVLTGGDVTNGTRLNGNPAFWGGYVEAGYWLTGETRGYKNGTWDRTKVLHGFDKGGAGAWQLNGRFSYLDLTDRVGASTTYTAPNYVNGGRQIGYLASVIWQPIDYVRFTWQYTRGDVKGGPRQAQVNGAAACPANSLAATECSFGYNVFAMRAAFDF